MTQAQKASAINRINTRYSDIVREFGENSKPARNYYAAMRAAAGDNITKSGRISKGKKATEEISEEALRLLEKRETLGQIKNRIRERLRKEKAEYFNDDDEIIEDVTDYEIIEDVNQQTEIDDALDEIGASMSDVVRAVWQLKGERITGRKLTYSEIAEGIDVIKKGTFRSDKKSIVERYF